MLKDLFQGPMFRLNMVVMSSLALLAYGLRTPSGTIEVLQLPVAALQVYFIGAVALQVGVQGLFAPLNNAQRGLIGALIVHVVFVSTTSPLTSAHILGLSWIVHILFSVALISFFRDVNLDKAEIVWSALGLTALIHVSAFMAAWVIWPDEIRRMNLPAVGNIRHLTYFLTPAATAMAIQFTLRSEKAIPSIVCYAAAAFFIIYTGSRAAAMGVTLALLVASAYAIWFRQPIQIKRIVIFLGVTVALVVSSELLPSLPWWTLLGRWYDAMGDAGPELSSGRYELWAHTMKAIEHKWVSGYGPALLGEIASRELWPERLRFIYQPHNIGLQLLFHWGVLGTVILALTILSFAANMWAALRHRPALSVLPLALLVAMLIQALADGNLFYPFSVIIAIIAFAALEAIGRRQSPVRTDAPKERASPKNGLAAE